MTLEGEELLEGDVGGQDEEVAVSGGHEVSAGGEAAHGAPPDPHFAVLPQRVEQQVVQLEGVRQAHSHVQTWEQGLGQGSKEGE